MFLTPTNRMNVGTTGITPAIKICGYIVCLKVAGGSGGIKHCFNYTVCKFIICLKIISKDGVVVFNKDHIG